MPSSSIATDPGAPPPHVSGATVVTPALATNTIGIPSPMPPHAQAQAQTTAEPTQTSSAPAPAGTVDAGQPSVPSDPVMHDRVDAVMGGK